MNTIFGFGIVASIIVFCLLVAKMWTILSAGFGMNLFSTIIMFIVYAFAKGISASASGH